MLFPRILAIIIIGGGYLIVRSIFNRFPLSRDGINYSPGSVLLSYWFLAFLIIAGQMIYIWIIFSRLFRSLGKGMMVLYVFEFTIVVIYGLMLLRKYRG